MTVGPVEVDDVDLTACDREPIHLSGAVQPHGALVAVDLADGTVLQASTNVGAVLDLGRPVADVLGRPLADLLGAGPAALVTEALGRERPDDANPLRLETAGRTGPRTVDGIVHRTADGLGVVELEPQAADAQAPSLLHGVRASLSRLRGAADVAALCRAAAAVVRDATGFDRVMVYRFWPDGHGSVVAEERREDLEPFLGLHYPASDIPQQARRLYLANRLRLIVDVGYRPVPIEPAADPRTGAPLDLGGSVLRSVSPVHVQYLRNMGVAASMSISLVVDGALWGLIACHHGAPHRVPYAVRATCEVVGEMTALLLAERAEEEDYEHRVGLRAAHARLVEAMADAPDLETALAAALPLLPALTDAAGAAVVHRGVCRVTGRAPDAGALQALLPRLAPLAADDLLAAHALPALVPDAAGLAPVAAGVVLLPLSRIEGTHLLWFRPETVQTVTWAGDPRKPVTLGEDGTARLGPRRSFAAWTETVRGTAQPWRPEELDAARDLGRTIAGLVLRRIEELARLNDELRRSNEELDTFAHVVSHDLKEPLRGLDTSARFVVEDYGGRLGDDGRTRLERLVVLARRMDAIIDALLEVAHATRVDLRLGPVPLDEVVADVLELYGPRIEQLGVEVRVRGPLPVVHGDRALLVEVYGNLVSNALKYGDKEQRWIEFGALDRRTDGVLDAPAPPDGLRTLYVRDNGIGIEERHRTVVFEMFRRLHPRDRYGDGTGAGLAIVKRMIERQGGTVWIGSVPGRVTTVFFTLPAAQSDRLRSAARRDSP